MSKETKVEGVKQISCKKCGQMMTLKQGISKNGKPYRVWRCEDWKYCGESEFVNESKVSIKEMFNKEVAKPQTTPTEKKEPLHVPTMTEAIAKVDWDGKELRDFRSRALAQVSSKLNKTDAEDDLEWADRVIMVAELRFLHYIYNGYEKPKEETPF